MSEKSGIGTRRLRLKHRFSQRPKSTLNDLDLTAIFTNIKFNINKYKISKVFLYLLFFIMLL